MPSDLGAYLLHRTIAADGAGEMTDTTLVVTSLRGGLSGGTIDSIRVISELAKDSDTRRLLLNPQALSGGSGDTRASGSTPSRATSVRSTPRRWT